MSEKQKSQRDANHEQFRSATLALALSLGFRRADFGDDQVIYLATEDGLIALADAYKKRAAAT